jgi:hypothetical protein
MPGTPRSGFEFSWCERFLWLVRRQTENKGFTVVPRYGSTCLIENVIMCFQWFSERYINVTGRHHKIR